MNKAFITFLLTLVCTAWSEDWRIEVENRSGARRNLVVSHVINKQLASLMEENALFEVTGDGKSLPVPFAVDTSGDDPALVWLMKGVTEPNERRFFEIAPKKTVAVLADGLKVVQDDTSVRIENRDFRLKHPLKGGGGFPADITYASSNFKDSELYFLDRIVRKTDDGKLLQYCAKDCKDASARLLCSSSLRAVVEVRTGFGSESYNLPGSPRAVYRYTYTAFSPVVEVTAELSRDDLTPWRELHFLHLSRKERGTYKEIITGAPIKKRPLNKNGDKSGHETGANWAILSDGVNACGAGYNNVLFWDASDEFVYYIRSGHCSWETKTGRFSGALYFGSAADENAYDAWMGKDHTPDITFYRDGRRCYPKDWSRADGRYILDDPEIRISFDSPEWGFDCTGIENNLDETVRFVSQHDEEPGFWKLMFKTLAGPDGRRDEAVIDNHTPAMERFARRNGDEMVFSWKGIDLPGETGVVSVTARVSLKNRGESEWLLDVKNRSRKFGLWHTEFPRLLSVTEPGTAELALPTGNWGGSLYRRFSGNLDISYPSARCPVQCMAAFLGDAGLYIAAHDGSACAKELCVNSYPDVMIRSYAQNAGIPGTADSPDFPVVISVLKGSWWDMARRYRRWALEQEWTSKGPIKERTDYPPDLQDLSFWMITSGGVESNTNVMRRAGELYKDLKIGTHWYNWHMIPFDNSYPEYFPTKPGVPDATRRMVENGQVIMPYINGRLWDRDIDSFTGARPAACKDPSGDIYVEHYGHNPRNLVPMCPYTQLWQGKVGEICTRLVNQVGVNAIHLDQIGAAKPRLCFDYSHGHPVGGGYHWVDGYRRMLTPIKEFAAKKGVILTTENTAEPYMDNIDAYLTWNPRYDTDIPLLPAIYSGYTTYFSSPQAADDTLDAFCAAQGRDFLWGCQLGWNSSWILEDKHRAKQEFQYQLCRCRAAYKEYFVNGQLLDEIYLDENGGNARHVWNRNNAHCVNLPAVMGTIWNAPDGSKALFLVNTVSKAVKIRFDLSKQPQLKSRWRWKLRKLMPEGTEEEIKTKGIIEFEMAPHSVLVYVIE